jgi:hypothetical protein
LAESENILVDKEDLITRKIVCQTISELFMSSKACIVKAKKSSQVDPSFAKPRRAWGYIHLKRKQTMPVETLTRECLTVEEEWLQLTTTISSVAAEYNWHVCINIEGFSLSCIKHENLSFNGQRVITEIVFSRIDQHNKIDLKVKRHAEYIDISDIENKTADMPIMEKVRFVISLLSKSPLCMGFDDDGIENFNIQHNCYVVKNLVDITASEECKIYSTKCKMFTNVPGKICSSCKNLKRCIAHAKTRLTKREHNINIHSHFNHRYMTQGEIVKKLDMQKAARIQQEMINAERELIEMSKDDHQDLIELFKQANSKDIPEDMAVLWDQQQQLLSTDSSKGYRWHPRY